MKYVFNCDRCGVVVERDYNRSYNVCFDCKIKRYRESRIKRAPQESIRRRKRREERRELNKKLNQEIINKILISHD